MEFINRIVKKYGYGVAHKMGLFKKPLLDLLRSRNHNVTIANYNAIYTNNPNRSYRGDNMKDRVKELIPHMPNDARIFDGGCGNGWGSLYVAGLLPHIAAVDAATQGVVPVDGLKQGDDLLQEQLKESHTMVEDIAKQGGEQTTDLLKGDGKQFHIVAVDIAQEGLDILKTEVEKVGLTDQIEAKNISISQYLEELKKQYILSNQKFDLMICMNSLQYEKNLAPVIENMQSHTKRGGYHVISIPLFCTREWKGRTADEVKDLYPKELYDKVHERQFNGRSKKNLDRPWLDVIFKKL